MTLASIGCQALSRECNAEGVGLKKVSETAAKLSWIAVETLSIVDPPSLEAVATPRAAVEGEARRVAADAQSPLTRSHLKSQSWRMRGAICRFVSKD